MADISAATLKDEVNAFLQGADLEKVTSKVVRQKVGEKLGVDLSDKRKEIDALVMAYVDNQASSEDVSDEESQTRGKATKSDSDAEIPDEDHEDDEYTPGSKKAKKQKPKKRKADSDDDSDEDWGKKKKAKPAAASGGRKQSAFTKSFRLSPELADVVGADVMPRHEVVKKLWAVIKERNLQDPKQKQFAICDDQLMKVFGIKRFRTFGMMKYLKDHFVEAV